MLEQQLKKQIVNTITQYKHKCDELDDEINVLKSAIYQLSLLPNGIHVGVDRQKQNLKPNLQENQDSTKIKNSVGILVNAMSGLQKTKQEHKTTLSNFIKKGTTLLGKMIVTAKDKKTFEQAAKLIQAETDEQELIAQFTKLLGDSVNWVNEQMISRQNNHLQAKTQDLQPLTVDSQINARLSLIIEQLLIPEDLATKLAVLKSNLAQQLTNESLTNVVDNLTDLVIEAFNLEHNQFKGFLNAFAANLHDFDSYLQLSINNNRQSQHESKQLEEDLQDSIKTVKRHVHRSKTIKELSYKIDGDLELIAEKIKLYRVNESVRIRGYEEKIWILQTMLNDAEPGVEDMQQQLSTHRISINKDFITGLPNRLAFDEFALQAYHRWQRGFGEMSLALVDIDHFKEINDKYGHLFGDELLKKIATLFKTSLRAVDYIARYSVIEFALVLEHTPAHVAWKVLENLRIEVEETVLCPSDTKIAITACFGLTSLQHGDTIDALLVRADEAKRQAKQGGCNRVILAGQESSKGSP